MANKEHLGMLDQGIDVWNAWRLENPGVVPDLSGADLQSANLSGADLTGADLVGADLTGAILTFAVLANAKIVSPEYRPGNPEHLAILHEGQEPWREWRQENPDVDPDLGGNSALVAALEKAQVADTHSSQADTFVGNPEHLAMLQSGVEAWNAWRQENEEVWPDLSGANLVRADLEDADLSGTTFYRANLSRANLSFANCLGANFAYADLFGADFRGANLYSSELGGANLVGAQFWDAELAKARITGAEFFEGDAGQLAILYSGVETWNTWRQEHQGVEPKLNGANLVSSDLYKVDLSRARLQRAHFSNAECFNANLAGADLHMAVLRNTSFLSANLSGACLSIADLRGSDFGLSTLAGAELKWARLDGASFRDAILTGADLSHARLDGANLARSDMTGALLIDTSLTEANLDGTILANADLTGSNLRKTTLIETVLDGASLTGCKVYGVSAWSLDLSKVANQSELVITDFEEAEITVDNLEVAQFVYLMLRNNKIRDIIDTVTGKGVLILGRFTSERKAVLDGIRDRLREHNFVPMVFDWDKSPGRDLTETVQLLANMSRFVVADVTDAKSIPQELQSIVPNLPSVPVRPIILSGQREYAMFEHFKPYPWVLDVFAYDDINHLVDNLEEAIISPITRWEEGSGETSDVADELQAKDQEIERLRAELAAFVAKP